MGRAFPNSMWVTGCFLPGRDTRVVSSISADTKDHKYHPELSWGLNGKCMDVQGDRGPPLISPWAAVEGSLLAKYNHSWRQWSGLN